MMHTWKRFLAAPVLALLVTAGCSDSPIDTVVTVDPGVSVAGLTFTLAGATLSVISTTLPTLIGISAVTSAGSSAAATAVNIGVGLGARVSRTSALSLQVASN